MVLLNNERWLVIIMVAAESARRYRTVLWFIQSETTDTYGVVRSQGIHQMISGNQDTKPETDVPLIQH
jgi:hypothetical protein